MLRLSLPVLSLTLLPALAVAQTQGTFTPFGSGCGRSGAQCGGHNPQGNNNYGTLPNEYALPFTVTATTIMTGVRFYTSAVTAPTTVPARLFQADTTGAPQATPFAETKITIGKNLQMWQASFDKPMPLTAGTWFVSYEPYVTPSTTIDVNAPQVPNGTVTIPTKAYWRRPTSTAWSATGIVNKPWFEILCSGGPPIVMGNTGVPMIGQSYSFDLSQGSGGSIALGVLAASNTAWGAIPLPLDLSGVAPGCWLFSSLDLLFPQPVSASGNASVKIGVPGDKGLIGVKIYHQYLMLDNGANLLNILFSNGAEVMIGG